LLQVHELRKHQRVQLRPIFAAGVRAMFHVERYAGNNVRTVGTDCDPRSQLLRLGWL